MSAIEIVSTLEGRLDEVCAIERASFGDPWSRAAFETSLGAAYCLTFGALLDGAALAGYALVYCIAGDAELVNIAVAPQYRGGGIGRALLDAAIGGAAGAGAAEIMLEVRISNLPARSLYERAGFQSTGVRRNYYTDPREDAVLMALSLDGDRSGGGDRAKFSRRNDNLC